MLSSPEAELKLPQLQRDLPLGLQKEGVQGLLPLPAPFHSSGPAINPGQATQQADIANDSKFRGHVQEPDHVHCSNVGYSVTS